jgi:hypothetical protein
MKGKILALLCFCLPAIAAHSQSDATIWNNSINKQEDNRYIINMPDGWKKVAIAENSGLDYKFDFSGVGIPPMVSGSPLLASFTIARIPGNKYAQAMAQVLNDFTVFYDRVTEPGYNYDTTTVAIKTGQAGTMVHTRFYRRSKVSNYSKYYLILYSPKTDETYTLTVSFQYKDPMYDIERSAHFTDYAKSIFAHFELR